MNIQKLYFSLPFFGHQSETLKDDLLNLLRQYFPHYFILSKFSSTHKDTLNKGMRSAVVYKYVCHECGAHEVCWVYYSEPIATRAADYAGTSVRAGVSLLQQSQSHILDRLLTCGGPQIAFNHFEMIDTCNNNILELRILESLHIAKIKPVFQLFEISLIS